MLTAGMLKPDQVERYRDDGFLIVRDVFSPSEMNEAAMESERLFTDRRDLMDSNNIRCRWQNHHETGECRFDTFDPVIDLSGLMHRIATDQRIFEIMGQLYGEEACLFKDKLIYKPPGARGYDLHQDYIGWKSFPTSFVTVLVPIDPSDAENGATEVFPGYHKAGYLSPMDGEYHPLPMTTVDESTGVKLELNPGDIAVFGGMTPHRSAANCSPRWRRQLYLSYNAKSDGGEQRDAHYREFHTWLKKKYAEYGKHETYFQ